GEECDDGNVTDHDGCSASCFVESCLTGTWSAQDFLGFDLRMSILEDDARSLVGAMYSYQYPDFDMPLLGARVGSQVRFGGSTGYQYGCSELQLNFGMWVLFS